MKESYREGVANHPDPEPCEGSREAALKRWTGVSVGWVLSSEIVQCREPTASSSTEGKTRCAVSQLHRGPAESKTPCMQRNSMRENREAPPPPAEGWDGRRRR